MNKLYAIFLLTIITSSTFARRIEGTITDENNTPIPYASVYIQQLTTGTISDLEGKYTLDIPEGDYKIVFQYLGYVSFEATITGENDIQLDVSLIPQNVKIKEIKVLASGEDAAYYVMRRAISMAPYYKNQISKYNCRVYLKGTGNIKKVPRLFRKKLKEGGFEQNKPFVLESVSDVEFELPDQLRQKVVAYRSSGRSNNTSPQQMITTSLYDTDNYGIVSPLSIEALTTYEFKLLGIFEDQGRVINKIEVTPKRKGKDVFWGVINVAETYWNLHSADLNLKLPMTKVKMHQQYAAVNDNVWMPIGFDFDMNFGGLGFQVDYKYIASISDYKTKLNPNINHNQWFEMRNTQKQDSITEQQLTSSRKSSGEVIELTKREKKRQQKIDNLLAQANISNSDSKRLQNLIKKQSERNLPPEPLEIKQRVRYTKKALKNDSTFWCSARPIPLTAIEKKSFSEKDSLVTAHNTPEHKDSVRNANRKFKASHLLVGKYYRYNDDEEKAKHFSINFSGLADPTNLSYNIVDGFRMKTNASFQWSDTLGHYTAIRPTLTYNFARQKMGGKISITRRYNGIKQAYWGFTAGSLSADYNPVSGISRLSNSASSLLFGKNKIKFYQNNFANLLHSFEPTNGMTLTTALGWSNRSTLQNNTSYTFLKENKGKFNPNVPDNNLIDSKSLNESNALIFSGRLSYTPRSRYYIRNNVKIRARSKYPTLALSYKKGVSKILDSDVDYDLLSFDVTGTKLFKQGNLLKYRFATGAFLNKASVYFNDFSHFTSANTTVALTYRPHSFKLLPLYAAATNDRYLEIHTAYEQNRFLLKRLPILNNSTATESIFVNYLTTPQLNYHYEVGYGLRGLFFMLDAEVVYSKNQFGTSEFALRFCLNM